MKLHYFDGQTLIFNTGSLLVEVPSIAMGASAGAPHTRFEERAKVRRPNPLFPSNQPVSPIPSPAPDWRDFPPPKVGGPGSMIIRPVGDPIPGDWPDAILHLDADFSELSWKAPRDFVANLLARNGHDAASTAHAYTLLDVHVPRVDLAKGLDPDRFGVLFEPGGVGLNAVRLLWNTNSTED
jgi:hypothetical protein